MILYIDTAKDEDKIELKIVSSDKVVARKKVAAKRAQAEKLLGGIEKTLLGNDLKLGQIDEIRVNSKGGSFTSLRIGVITANALGLALGVPVKSFYGESKRVSDDISIACPEYSGEPNITTKKKS